MAAGRFRLHGGPMAALGVVSLCLSMTELSRREPPTPDGGPRCGGGSAIQQPAGEPRCWHRDEGAYWRRRSVTTGEGVLVMHIEVADPKRATAIARRLARARQHFSEVLVYAHPLRDAPGSPVTRARWTPPDRYEEFTFTVPATPSGGAALSPGPERAR